jgi:UPF0042 nucleotide-binding protein
MAAPDRRLVFVTGLSGAGKSTALRALEDAGYYCVDNLPLRLVAAFLAETAALPRVAIAADLRSVAYGEAFLPAWEAARAQVPGALLLFLEASEKALERRFAVTRRPHPLATDRPVIESIRAERATLEPIKAKATEVMDTSNNNLHELRHAVLHRFDPNWASERFLVSVTSFGYSYGVPSTVDLVFDTRFLPNPYFVPDLRDRTGEDPEVAAYVLGQPASRELIDRVLALLDFYLPAVQRDFRHSFAVGIGCTGGRHRSVAIANALAEPLRARECRVHVMHRDIKRGEG